MAGSAPAPTMDSALRLHQWWSGKIPPAIAVAYLALARSTSPLDLADAVGHLALFLVSCFGIGGLGYLITDAFDVEEDRRLGKQNGWASMATRKRTRPAHTQRAFCGQRLSSRTSSGRTRKPLPRSAV